MGWVWKDDEDDPSYSAGDVVGEFGGSSKSTRKVVRSQCRTEEVETGKFIRKCEKTEQFFRDTVGRPNEVVESYKEYTEEDITDQMVKGSFSFKPGEDESSFFPGLRSDLDAIERHLFSGMNSLFRAAEDMRSEFFHSVWAPHISDDEAPSSYRKPTDYPNDTFTKKKSTLDGDDLSRIASDV